MCLMCCQKPCVPASGERWSAAQHMCGLFRTETILSDGWKSGRKIKVAKEEDMRGSGGAVRVMREGMRVEEGGTSHRCQT